jgi:hypothetical protein
MTDDAVIEEVEQQDEPQVSNENVDALVDDNIDDDAIPGHKPMNHDCAEVVMLNITQDENNVAAAEVLPLCVILLFQNPLLASTGISPKQPPLHLPKYVCQQVLMSINLNPPKLLQF